MQTEENKHEKENTAAAEKVSRISVVSILVTDRNAAEKVNGALSLYGGYIRAHGDSVQRKERFGAFGGAGRARGNYERADGETRKNRRRFGESFVRKNLTAGYRIGIAAK